MSRTYKDKPYKLKFPERYRDDYYVWKEELWLQKTSWMLDSETSKSIEVPLPFPVWRVSKWELQGPTTKTKKKRHDITKQHRLYCTAPSWWRRMLMIRPQRHKGRAWERKVLIEDIEETDPPGVSRKPFVYYY